MLLLPEKMNQVFHPLTQGIKTISGKLRDLLSADPNKFMNLFVDISAYPTPTPQTLLNKTLSSSLVFIFTSCTLGYIINDSIVFFEDTTLLISQMKTYLAYTFLMTGLLSCMFIHLLTSMEGKREIHSLMENILFSTARLSLLVGMYLMALLLIKSTVLIQAPELFDHYANWGPMTVYELQGIFFLAFSLGFLCLLGSLSTLVLRYQRLSRP